MKVFSSAAMVAMLSVGSLATAGQLVVTPEASASKSGQSFLAIDVATDGNVSGLNFFVRTGEIGKGAVDLSKCVADLPKGFVGHCAQRADGIGVIAYAEGKATLPAGVVSVGRLGLPAAVLAKSGGLVIEELTFADVNGDAVSSESVVAEQ